MLHCLCGSKICSLSAKYWQDGQVFTENLLHHQVDWVFAEGVRLRKHEEVDCGCIDVIHSRGEMPQGRLVSKRLQGHNPLYLCFRVVRYVCALEGERSAGGWQLVHVIQCNV